MTDIVQECIDDLTVRMNTVSAVQQKIIYLYTQDELLGAKKKLGFPAVGIVYVGMRGKEDSSKTGLAAVITCDIYLVGGDQCDAFVAGSIKHTTTSLLNDIRDAIKADCDPAPGGRKWKFVFELPADFSETLLAYVQRWSTVVLLTN